MTMNFSCFDRIRTTVILAALVGIAGCKATNPTNPAPVMRTPTPGVATIVGWGNTAAENADAALTPDYGSTRVTRLYVSFVNGVKTGFGENIVRVSPGSEVIVMCGIYVNYRFFTYDERLDATLAADRVYELRAYPSGRRCQPYVEDVTAKK